MKEQAIAGHLTARAIPEAMRERMTHYYRLQNTRGTQLSSFAMPGFQASIVKTRCAGEAVFEHCEPHHRIIITLDGSTASTFAEAQGAAPVDRADRPGSVTIVPAGTRRRVLLKESALSLVTIAIAPNFLHSSEEANVPLIQNGRDDWLWRAGGALRNAAVKENGRLECEGLALAVARHVERLPAVPRRRPTGLDPAALRRVLALMNDRVADDLSLADLAAECGLGISAFGRAFRQSTGSTPHRYLTGVRMQRAKELLRQRQMPLALIAGSVGYSDQAHFTTAFARHNGIPPARWREVFRGSRLSADIAQDAI